jgi:thioredoxin
MPDPRNNANEEPTRAQVDALPGATVLEFGAAWCGHCTAAQPAIHAALSDHPRVRHLKVEDGRGRRLGRSYRVKLWPTLVFLRDGVEVARLVRQDDPGAIREALSGIDPDANRLP